MMIRTRTALDAYINLAVIGARTAHELRAGTAEGQLPEHVEVFEAIRGTDLNRLDSAWRAVGRRASWLVASGQPKLSLARDYAVVHAARAVHFMGLADSCEHTAARVSFATSAVQAAHLAQAFMRAYRTQDASVLDALNDGAPIMLDRAALPASAA